MTPRLKSSITPPAGFSPSYSAFSATRGKVPWAKAAGKVDPYLLRATGAASGVEIPTACSNPGRRPARGGAVGAMRSSTSTTPHRVTIVASKAGAGGTRLVPICSPTRVVSSHPSAGRGRWRRGERRRLWA